MRVEGQGSLTSPSASRTIIVAGAGIGGLTAAIALAAHFAWRGRVDGLLGMSPDLDAEACLLADLPPRRVGQ